MTAKAPQKEPKKPVGVSFSALGPLEVSIELPGVADPATGDPAVVTFLCARPTTGIEAEQKAIQADVRARDGSPFDAILGALSVVCVDLWGVSDFAPRREGEPTDEFRERFRSHMAGVGDAAEHVLAAALNRYVDLSEPKASFRSFPRAL